MSRTSKDMVEDAMEQWLAFTKFCSQKRGVNFTLPKLFLVIDRE